MKKLLPCHYCGSPPTTTEEEGIFYTNCSNTNCINYKRHERFMSIRKCGSINKWNEEMGLKRWSSKR